MPRPLRIETNNAFYHIIDRGYGRKKVFHGPKYYQAFLQCLKEAYQRFSLEIHSYCLLGDHYHLLVKTPQGNLSRAMRHVNGLYTQRYNRLRKTDGPLFRGRYKAVLIDANNYLLALSRYIHRMPIDIKKPLVKHLSQYPWSSYPDFSNKQKTPDWLYQESVFTELGARNKFQGCRKFVAEGNDEEITNFYNKGNLSSVMGDKLFKERALSGIKMPNKKAGHEKARQAIGVNTILTAVQTYYGCQRKDILKTVRGRGPRNYVRWIAMKLCQTDGQLSLMAIAKRFNIGNYSTVSQTIKKLNNVIQEDKDLARDVNTISKNLSR